MIVCTFAYRYEPDWLIDQLKENLSWVDGFASWNTRNDPRPWIPRRERQRELNRRALKMGASWILVVSPDERLEPAAAKTLRKLTHRRTDRFRFRVRELWTPTHYRVDGIWGRKTGEPRFYTPESRRGRQLDLNVYHLKMIEPANRVERHRVHTEHNTWDNRRMGFDYMVDNRGLQLEEIPPHRMYDPPYRRYEFKVP